MYWDVVLQEVLNKHSPGYVFIFTNLADHLPRKAIRQEGKKPRCNKTYFLGAKYQNIYLTQRETECVLYLLTGLTVKIVAEKLGLSTRTVEFYINNIKAKLKCRTKTQLLSHIKNSQLLDIIDFNMPAHWVK
jgi:DNA-binding CsgD family transcriptional regulator